ncbi:TonB-dependent receptor domain-containing protein, partial [Acetobacter sp.]|uniref:TonB-dependent receptor domain-containing protein n=1 Tax=Acetobacter sp. TaxID=440 RepID=UPI0039E9D8B4
DLNSANGNYLYRIDQTHQTDKFTGKFGLEYNIIHSLMAYATISNGFKPGTYFSQASTSASSIAYIKPENLLAYEVGLKYLSNDGHLSLSGSLFDYEYRNRQTLMLAESPTGYFVSLGSIPKSRTRGGELQASWKTPLPGLNIEGNFAYLDGIIQKGPDSLRGATIVLPITAHSALPFAPKFSWSAIASYSHKIADVLIFRTQVSYSWKDNMWTSLGDMNAKTSKIQSLGFRMSLISTRKKPWHVDFYVDNLTNRHGDTYSFSTPDNSRGQYIQTPRWFGFEIGQIF